VKPDELQEALESAFVSPNEPDRNLEPSNMVDGLYAIARAIRDLAAAVRESKSLNADKAKEDK